MGRPSGGGRATAGETLHLDVARLARDGLFSGGTRTGLWNWTRGGEPSGSTGFTATPDALVLRYTSRDYTGEAVAHAPRLELEWTPCPFGGRRPWFLCPRCGRRCRVVYLRGATACRRCHRLAYQSQREDASSRAHRRGRKLMERLGATGQDAWDLALHPHLADKPRRMRWATYDRIVAEAAEAEDRRLLALLPVMERFAARFGSPRLK